MDLTDKTIDNFIELASRGVDCTTLRRALNEEMESPKMLRKLKRGIEDAHPYLCDLLKRRMVNITESLIYNDTAPDLKLVEAASSYSVLRENLMYFKEMMTVADGLHEPLFPSPDTSSPVHKMYALMFRDAINASKDRPLEIKLQHREFSNYLDDNPFSFDAGGVKYEMIPPPLDLWISLLNKIKAEAGMRIVPVENTTAGVPIISWEYQGYKYDFEAWVHAAPKTVPSQSERIELRKISRTPVKLEFNSYVGG